MLEADAHTAIDTVEEDAESFASVTKTTEMSRKRKLIVSEADISQQPESVVRSKRRRKSSKSQVEPEVLLPTRHEEASFDLSSLTVTPPMSNPTHEFSSHLEQEVPLGHLPNESSIRGETPLVIECFSLVYFSFLHLHCFLTPINTIIIHNNT